jgi:hypothetical protein
MDAAEKRYLEPDQEYQPEELSQLDQAITALPEAKRSYWESTMKYYVSENGRMPLDYGNALAPVFNLRNIDQMRHDAGTEEEKAEMEEMWSQATQSAPSYEEYVARRARSHGENLAKDLETPEKAEQLAKELYDLALSMPSAGALKRSEIDRRIDALNITIGHVRTQDAVDNESDSKLRRQVQEINAMIEGKQIEQQ